MPQDENEAYELAKHILEGMRSLERLSEQINQNALISAELKVEMKEVRDTLQSINRAVYGFNGSPSILTRLSDLEKDSKVALEWFRNSELTKKEREKENRRLRWRLLIAIFSGSGLVSFLLHLAGTLLKGN